MRASNSDAGVSSVLHTMSAGESQAADNASNIVNLDEVDPQVPGISSAPFPTATWTSQATESTLWFDILSTALYPTFSSISDENQRPAGSPATAAAAAAAASDGDFGIRAESPASSSDKTFLADGYPGIMSRTPSPLSDSSLTISSDDEELNMLYYEDIGGFSDGSDVGGNYFPLRRPCDFRNYEPYSKSKQWTNFVKFFAKKSRLETEALKLGQQPLTRVKFCELGANHFIAYKQMHKHASLPPRPPNELQEFYKTVKCANQVVCVNDGEKLHGLPDGENDDDLLDVQAAGEMVLDLLEERKSELSKSFLQIWPALEKRNVPLMRRDAMQPMEAARTEIDRFDSRGFERLYKIYVVVERVLEKWKRQTGAVLFELTPTEEIVSWFNADRARAADNPRNSIFKRSPDYFVMNSPHGDGREQRFFRHLKELNFSEPSATEKSLTRVAWLMTTFNTGKWCRPREPRTRPTRKYRDSFGHYFHQIGGGPVKAQLCFTSNVEIHQVGEKIERSLERLYQARDPRNYKYQESEELFKINCLDYLTMRRWREFVNSK